MKTSLFLAIFAFFLGNAAQANTLLTCSYIEQSDIRTAKVESLSDSNYVQLTLVSPTGLITSFKIDSEEYSEGWIELPEGDMYERYLTRTATGWEIFSTQGTKIYRFQATCEEAPL